ncbi:MAG: hypothetical protein AAF696_20100, partial [Bacteroidota bacterium]
MRIFVFSYKLPLLLIATLFLLSACHRPDEFEEIKTETDQLVLPSELEQTNQESLYKESSEDTYFDESS